MHESRHLLVAYGNVAAGLVGDVHVVVLLHQASYGAAHRDDVVVRMRREHDHTLGVGLGTLRAVGVVHSGLASRPSCDGVLQFVEHLNVDKAGLPVELLYEVSQVVVDIVLGRELEQWLAHMVAEVDDLPAQLVLGQLDGGGEV